ncbi:MAG: hypothetical protein COA70_06475 [Planctomycetota bacterium]|nr:MAG: hypothetical protein COA70_06475 [Planctomycetota bacterium]
MFLVYKGHAFSWMRALLPMIALLFFDEQRRKRPSKGWPGMTPNGGTKLWLKVSLIVSAWAILLWSLLYGVSALFDFGPGFTKVDPEHMPVQFFSVTVIAPVLEEGVYRILLCTALATRFRHRTVIAISGTAFALLHLLYGTLAPTNLLAGYLLSWAYLMSGSLWIPIVWHAVGNVAILTAGMVLFLIAGA